MIGFSEMTRGVKRAKEGEAVFQTPGFRLER